MSGYVRVWDLPTRLFHWSLAACIAGLAITGKLGGGVLEWHARIGYAVLTLLLFRIVWGFVGGHWSRFAAFVLPPRETVAYLRGQFRSDHLIGHNPLGALSVLAMLALLLTQVGSGLIADDEIAFTGPLNRLVSSAQGLAATWYHKRIGQWVIFGLVLAHLGAVGFHFWSKGENLVKPMLHGDKVTGAGAVASRDDAGSRMAALGVLLGCAVAVKLLLRLGN